MNMKKNTTREYVIRSQEQEIRCILFRRKCKTLRIVVTPDLQVKITAPLRASDSFIQEAVREKTPWILRSIHRLNKCTILPLPEKYESGEKLSYLGNEYKLMVIRGKRSQARLEGGILVVQLPGPEMKSVKREVDRWYRLHAEIIFSECLKRGYSYISEYGVTEPFLKIRRMKSRWGSCSRTGEITLNLRLIHLPLSCIEYIVMHELCHLKHLNHSKDYYSFLQGCMPDWKERKAILESFRL
jgi:predicted metal-dependent hydrolase